MQTKKNYDKELNIAYMIILMLYPMLKVNQGLSIMDTTYSLSNYAFFSQMNGTWMVATYLSNVLGSMFVNLPFGETVLGMNIYTSLIPGFTALFSYYVLKRDINQHIVFIGEVLALSLCWCPTTILYNYLTYCLFTVGALLLYRSLAGAVEDRYVAAGLVLGISVAARFPNITEAALILAVWYVAFIEHKSLARVVKETLMCIGGYLIGIVFFYIVITLSYGKDAYFNMINTLFAMTDKATDYKPTSMITAMFADYIYAWKWIFLFAFVILAGAVTLYFAGRKIADGKTARRGITIAGLIVVAVLGVIRICYGQGMFTFGYYEYRSVYYWAVLLIAACTVLCVLYIFAQKNDSATALSFHHKKILSSVVLIEIYITCLGSNNGMYPIVNNLFIAAPFLLWVIYDWARSKNSDFTTFRKGLCYSFSIVLLVVYTCSIIQGIGFHSGFAIQDGDEGQSRDTQIQGYEVTANMYTTKENADNLQGLMDYVYQNGADVRKVLLYGNNPGLGFLLNKESALTTFWPDLDSYTYAEWERDLKAVKNEVVGQISTPYIITSIRVAAWIGGDPEAISFFGIDEEEYSLDPKLEDLVNFINECGYKQVYCNDGYSVYYIE